MSKSSTTTTSKIPPAQLPSKSAWAKGPPQTSASSSPRSQSPAPPANSQPHLTHSRRPSGLGQSVSVKDGVSVPKGNVGAAVKQATSAVTFGSIGDVSAPISASPAVVSPVPVAAKTSSSGGSGTVKSFGSVPATQPAQINGKAAPVSSKPVASSATSSSTTTSTASSTPPTSTSSTPNPPLKPNKIDVAKLFQNPSSAPSPPPPSDVSASPMNRPSNLPNSSQTPPMGSTPSQLGAHSYTPFVPQNGGVRQQPPQQTSGGPGGPNGSPGNPPRSPGFNRQHQQMANGNGSRPPGGPSGPGGPQQMSSGMPSPRLAPMPHPGQPAGMPPQQQQQMPPHMWPGGYYYVDPNAAYVQYPSGWYMPHQHLTSQHPHHPPPPAGHVQPHMPMSPRHHPPPLPGPGTPTPAHAVPTNHSPHQPPSSHSASNSISGLSSPPPTPSSAAIPSAARLNTSAPTFVPGGRSSTKITFKSPDGVDVNLADLQKKSTVSALSTNNANTASSSPTPTTTPPVGTSSPSRRISAIRIESPEDKAKRLAEEKKKEEKAREEEEKKKRQEEEKKAKEEREQKEKEEAEKRKREEEEKELLRKEEEEKERKRKEEEEKERLRKEEERKLKEAEEAERRRKEFEEAEKERVRKEKEAEEEKERLRKKEEEELKAKEAERLREEEAAAAKAAASTNEEPEEGEVVEEPKPIDGDKESKEKPKDKNLRIDTAPTSAEPRKRPGPLDLSGTHKPNIPAALPSALATARIIEDIGSVQYPEGIKSPKVELNVNAKNGKFRYDRDFLLQFMSICKEKPDNLPPLDAIGLEPAPQQGGYHALTRGGSGRGDHRTRANSGTQAPARQPSSGFPGSGSNFKSGAPNPFVSGMGNFGTQNAGKEFRSVSGSGLSSSQYGRPPPMQRTPSVSGSVSLGPGQTKRTRSKRGEQRNDSNRVGQGHGSSLSNFSSGYGQSSLEPVAPLQATANRWDRKAISAVDGDSPEVVDRKVRSLLNKLTMEKFDSISDQIIDWANRSEKEKDGRTLIQVIRLVFEKATDEATWSEMYARLCRKMMETISPRVQDDGIKNAEGNPIAGGQLFRKYLLNRCQEDFERGWVAKEATAAAAASKALEDQAAKAANEKAEGGEGEAALYSEEYYAAQKAKRQGLGLIKFIGELFKLQMLTERIMHECVKKLLGNVENPEEEEIESLCKLLSTVGAILDTAKARAHMDVYFSRMKELTKSLNVSSRMQFMLQDLIELRDRKWVSRNQVAAPTTIAQIHEAAAKEKVLQDTQRQMTMSRGGSKRGGDRGDYSQQPGADGWTTAGNTGPARPPPKAGDLSKFGKISSTAGAPATFGPASVFSNKGKDGKKESSLTRNSSNSNMFSMLSQGADAPPEPSKGSRPPSRKASMEFSQSSGSEPAPQRRRLILQPRSKPLETAQAPDQHDDSSSSSEEEDAAPEMTEAEAKKKIDEDLKEFFAVRNLEEAESYFSNLPAIHHHTLVDKLVSSALESKEADAKLVCDFFAMASEKELCSIVAFEAGFSSIAEFLDDIAIDAPKAPQLMALMMKGPMFEEEHRSRIASKSNENAHLLS